MENIAKSHQLRLETWQVKQQIWNQGFLTAKWWVNVVIILVFYIIWTKFSDKRIPIELLLFGSLIAVTRVVLDD